MSKSGKGKDPNVIITNSNTATSIGSSTASPTMSIPGRAVDSAAPDMRDVSLEEVTTMAAKVAAARAEHIISEKLSAANQAQALTTKMLNDATNMLENATILMGSITKNLEASSKIQAKLEDDIANIKGNTVSGLSIFVSFFAFITVSINVFSKAGTIVSALALLLVFWCLLVGFNIVIGWQFNTLKNAGLAWFLLILVSSLSVFAIVGLYYFSPELPNSARSVLGTS